MKKSSPKRRVEKIAKKYKGLADFMTNSTNQEKKTVMNRAARQANLKQKKMMSPKRREVKEKLLTIPNIGTHYFRQQKVKGVISFVTYKKPIRLLS